MKRDYFLYQQEQERTIKKALRKIRSEKRKKLKQLQQIEGEIK